MCMYVRLIGSLAHNLFRRVGDDLADCAVFVKRGCVYKMTCLRRGFDDVGPDEGDGEAYVALPEHQAQLVSGLERFSWFGHMDRKTAQIYVHRGGQGCFIVRPSSSTRSLTLTLWHENRTYNILVRRRDDGLIALGSKKHNEVAFRTIEEMCNHYSQNELILYSGGELAGKTLLKFPSQVISQQPSSSQSTPSGISHHNLTLRPPLNEIENSPQTLEESVHQAARRSMSLKTFRETQGNNQLCRNNSSCEKAIVNVHHKSYENVMLNLTQNSSLRHSVGTLIPNNSQVHPSYENIPHSSQTALTSTSFTSNRHKKPSDTGKENTENKRLASKITDKEFKRKRIKSSNSWSSTSTQLSIENIQPQGLDKNTEENNSVFKNSALKRTEKLLAPSEAEQRIIEQFKFNEKENNDSNCLPSTAGQSKSPLPSPKIIQKSRSFETSNEKIKQNLSAKKQFSSKEIQQSSTTLTSLEPKDCEFNQSEIIKIQSNEQPILANYSIDSNMKSSLASTEFVSKMSKGNEECKKVSDESIEQQIENPTDTKGLVQKTMENFRSKNSIEQPNLPLKIVHYQTDLRSPLIITKLVHNPSKNISPQETTKTDELKQITNASNNSVAKLKEHFLVSTPSLIQKSIKDAAHSEENIDPTSKSKVIKELQTQLQTNDCESNLPSAEKFNLVNSQKTNNKKQIFKSHLNTILTVNQEPNHKPTSKAKLAASFFEELAKQNQT